MEEIWKDIPNFDGYQVSNLGRVRTNNKTTYTELHGVRHWKNRILKFKGNTYHTGYRVDLWRDGKPHTMLVARLVAFTFNNEDINNHELTVDHVDGNRFNNNLTNLELVSLKENIIRGFDTGLYSTAKKVEVTDKHTNESVVLRSMVQASLYMNRFESFVSNECKKNHYENEDYKWEILPNARGVM